MIAALRRRAPRAPARRRATTTCSRSAVRERTAELRETQLEIIQRLAPGGRVARRGHRRAHRAHQPHVRARSRSRSGMTATEAELLAPRERAARRRQDRHPRRDPAQARQARRARSGTLMRRHTTIGAAHPRRLALAAHPHGRGDRAHPPRALGRRRATRPAWRARTIPLVGRICAVCDVFDALLLRSAPTRSRWPLDEALAELRAPARHALRPRARRRLPRARPRARRRPLRGRRRAVHRQRHRASAACRAALAGAARELIRSTSSSRNAGARPRSPRARSARGRCAPRGRRRCGRGTARTRTRSRRCGRACAGGRAAITCATRQRVVDRRAGQS